MSSKRVEKQEKKTIKKQEDILPRIRESRNVVRKNLAEEEDEEEEEDFISYFSPPKTQKSKKIGVGHLASNFEDKTESDKSVNRWSNSNTKQSCAICGTTETPQWRSGPGKRRLCNACGVKWSFGRIKEGEALFPFSMTESDNVEDSDPNLEEMDLEVGSAAWKLKLEVSRLSTKMKEIERNQKRLIKLLDEGGAADREIDRNYRKLISIAKRSKALEFSPKNAAAIANMFIRDDSIDMDDVEIRFGDSTDKEILNERLTESSFIKTVKSRDINF